MNMEDRAYSAMRRYLTKIEEYEIIDERDVSGNHYISGVRNGIIEIFKATYAVDAWSSTEFDRADFERIMVILMRDHFEIADMGIQRGLIHLNVIENDKGIIRLYHYGSDM